MANEGKSTVGVNSGKVRLEQGNNRLIVNDGTRDRLIIGEEDDGDIVVKLSQSAYDVKTATSAQLVMSSEFNMFKIVQSGTTSISKTATNSGTFVDVSHSLGYTPLVLAFINNTNSLFGLGSPLPCSHNYEVVTAPAYGSYTFRVIDGSCSLTADTTKVRFTVSTPSDTNGGGVAAYNFAYTIGIKYYILAETAS